MNCPNCNTQTVTNANYCHHCGEKIKSESAPCPICQTSNISSASNCVKCGVNLEFARASNSYKLPPLPENPTQSPKIKKRNPAASIVGFIFTCFLALLAYGFIKDVFIMPFLNVSAPVPTSRPAVTSASTTCIPWASVTKNQIGQTLCVYGTVKTHIYNQSTDKSYFYFAEKTKLYIIGTGQWKEPLQGVCIQLRGLLKTNNEIPYIQVDQLYECEQ